LLVALVCISCFTRSAPPLISTLSLHDALPISEGLEKLASVDVSSLPVLDGNQRIGPCVGNVGKFICIGLNYADHAAESNLPIPKDRKSTRLNSSHVKISYAVFCLKKKKKTR